MELEKQQIVNELFGKNAVIYEIPLYQRHYVWDDTNWKHLWDDITKMLDFRDANKAKEHRTDTIAIQKGNHDEHRAKEHFTGAIVIQDHNSSLEIIDGQQRLTTFQIILCAIRDICDTKFPKDEYHVKSQIERCMTPAQLEGSNQECKLLPREGQDQDIFLSLVKGEQEQLDKKSKIWKAYDYFKKQITAYVKNDYDRLYRVNESIMKDFIVVTIKVTQEDEYAKIFKSINNTGKHLDQFDLLRNDLFLRATSRDARDKWYNKYWHHFEEPDWRIPGVVDNFLKDFLEVKLGKDFDNQLNLFDLYELYCTQLKRKLNLSETDDKLVRYEFHELHRCSKVYQKLQKSESEVLGNRLEFYEEFFPYPYIVDQLKLYILCLVTEFGLSSCELNRIFNIFEAYVLRETLYMSSQGYNFQRLEDSIIDALNIDKKDGFNIVKLVLQLSTTWKTDKEIEHVLKNSLPQNEKNRKEKRGRSKIMSDFGGNYLFHVLGWGIAPDEILFKEFCKKWPSVGTMLQKELIGGLPIVYSPLPVTLETIQTEEKIQMESQLTPYMFVTYEGTVELSEYEIDTNIFTGFTGANSIKEIPVNEILLAFPSSAKSVLQSRYKIDTKRYRSNRAEVLNLEPTTKRYQIKDWILEGRPLLKTLTEESNSGFHILEIGVVTVVTRAGHVLYGELKYFSDVALYLEIQGEIVTVYAHGIYMLKFGEHFRAHT